MKPYDVRVIQRYASLAGWNMVEIEPRGYNKQSYLLTKGSWIVVASFESDKYRERLENRWREAGMTYEDYRNSTWPEFRAFNSETYEFANAPGYEEFADLSDFARFFKRVGKTS